MNNNIVFSIIIPTHNSSAFIKRLFDSIPLLDTVQVIVVDDHSSKNELKKLKKIFSKQRFKHKSFYDNAGINSAGAARNIGICNAKGRWLIFADSDDYFTNDFEKLLTKYTDVDSDIIYYRVDGNAKAKRVKSLNRLLATHNIEQIKYQHIVPWGKIISRELVYRHDIRFSEVIVSNDELFSVIAAYYAKKNILEVKSGYYSFERSDSLTTQNHSKDLHDIRMNEVLKKYAFLKQKLGGRNLRSLKLSVFSNIRKTVSVGGLVYALGWYIRLRRLGARIYPIDQLIKKVMV